jgi:hypothetical protein
VVALKAWVAAGERLRGAYVFVPDSATLTKPITRAARAMNEIQALAATISTLAQCSSGWIKVPHSACLGLNSLAFL